LKYIDYTLIEQSDRDKAKDDYKDAMNDETGGKEESKEIHVIDQDLIDARIDSTF